MCLWSRNDINHPIIDRQSFARLMEDSPCDNVLLEHQLALELRGLGYIEKLFPVLIGDFDDGTNSYSDFFQTDCWPQCPAVSVTAVKSDVRLYMSDQGLGSPLLPDITVREVMGQFRACQGGFIVGNKDKSFTTLADTIVRMVTRTSVRLPVAPSPAYPGKGLAGAPSPARFYRRGLKYGDDGEGEMELGSLRRSLAVKDDVIARLKQELLECRGQKQVMEQEWTNRLETSTLTEVRRLRSELATKEQTISVQQLQIEKLTVKNTGVP